MAAVQDGASPTGEGDISSGLDSGVTDRKDVSAQERVDEVKEGKDSSVQGEEGNAGSVPPVNSSSGTAVDAAVASVDAAAATVLFGWNSLMSSVTKNLETLGVETKKREADVQTGATTGGEEESVFSDMLSSVTKNLQNNLQSVDTTAVRENVDGISKSVQEAWSTAIGKVNDPYALLSDAQTMASQIPEVVFAKGDGDLLSMRRPPTEGEPIAPWNDLPEEDAAYSTPIREEMMKIVVDCLYSRELRKEMFASGLAEKDGFKFDFAKDGHQAIGALNADKNLRRFRAALVPSHVKEDVFWDNYFYHVDRIRRELRAGVRSSTTEAVPPSSGPEKTEPGADDRQAAASKRNWDEEIDKIFDEE